MNGEGITIISFRKFTKKLQEIDGEIRFSQSGKMVVCSWHNHNNFLSEKKIAYKLPNMCESGIGMSYAWSNQAQYVDTLKEVGACPNYFHIFGTPPVFFGSIIKNLEV